ncbi:MAG: hypothetical protein KDB79_12710 [Acidobacteria bacterium]|nr:hypothetical protein [Acidobacteriota bacterium]
MKKFFFCLLIATAFSVVNFSQSELEPRLVDEMRAIHCNDFLAHLDGFINELQNDKSSEAYVVIFGKKGHERENLIYEDWVRGHFAEREYSYRLNEIARGKLGDSIRIQFWIIHPGSKLPEVELEKWRFVLAENTKPYVFTRSDWNDGLCPSPEYLGLDNFSEFLNDNPKSSGNIVINETSKTKFETEKHRIQELLIKKYGISDRRLRFFFQKKDLEKYSEYYFPNVEVWLLP